MWDFFQGAVMSAGNDSSEVRKASFWISQLVIIIATVGGVYLAASQGLKQAVQFDAIKSEQNNYYLRKSLQNELADNVVYIREYADKVKRQIANAELNLETFVWNSMTYSPTALETPSGLLREAQKFYHSSASILSNKNFQPRNRAESLTVLADHVEKEVLPQFETNTSALRRALTGRGIAVD